MAAAGRVRAGMAVKFVEAAQKTMPTGNPKFVVDQSIPGRRSAEECDPFLMCDHFGPTPSPAPVTDPDEFPVGWHPHRGMDILTYMKSGTGRHADSLGNRETFRSPGMQWMSVGSGVEHAEGGGSAKGEMAEGFQIWVNVPSARKMEDPRYGTVEPEKIEPRPVGDGVTMRVLAGVHDGHRGPFHTVQNVQIFDVSFKAGSSARLTVPDDMKTCLLYASKGRLVVNGQRLPERHIAHMDGSSASRDLNLEAGPEGAEMMLFAGVPLRQPIAWSGPFVMTTREEINQVIRECRDGTFPPKRVSWDYRRAAARPR
eukprot:TRINITY_DN1984_c0_g1_i2.p1 TRINITY_DN1984_c0_g1~~TRINITY_DN1984_c0_g1_i2.p1  ORF type:complete len:332 (+),score=100.98 TRINITY_DN1984_c0_g1_i2:60-998(+)